ncbi:immunity 52 family protein [Archangium lansingense]|uniref:immunity 52 family protein n=1 Tax=Archangium lansingense TaxID=2995310 RepID=UPI003B7E4983
MDTYSAGVYWGCRVETAEECARRAENFFRLLSQCDPIYAHWFEKAASRKKALQLQFEPTAETFVRLFKKRSNKLGKVGFILGAWTGHSEGERGGAVRILCGSDALGASNSCFLYLPSEEPGSERVITVPVLTQMMRAMVLAWEPEWGSVFSYAYQELRDEPIGPPRMGWLMYFSRLRGELPPLPEPVRTQSVEDKGTLVILTPERFNGHDPAHVALADQVRGLLDQAGLLTERD